MSTTIFGQKLTLPFFLGWVCLWSGYPSRRLESYTTIRSRILNLIYFQLVQIVAIQFRIDCSYLVQIVTIQFRLQLASLDCSYLVQNRLQLLVQIVTIQFRLQLASLDCIYLVQNRLQLFSLDCSQLIQIVAIQFRL